MSHKSMLVMPVWAGLEEQRRDDKPIAVNHQQQSRK